jgi:hypothetical protein
MRILAIPNALVINASNVVTKITGEFGGAAIGAAINFKAISLGGNSFLDPLKPTCGFYTP